MSKALVVLSGGQDSTTCLYWAKEKFDEVEAITFNYGQRHDIEIEAAINIAAMADTLSHEVLCLEGGSGVRYRDLQAQKVDGVLHGTSPLVSNNELEQYADHESLPGGLEKTFVPMRNQLFLTLAANRAYCHGITDLVTGVCQEDFGGYPDCRQVFIDAIESACNLGTFTGEDGAPGPLKIHTPLMNLTKADSVHLAASLDGCMKALALSHTAYDGQYPPLGKDHATLLREKGFIEADTPDPLILRAVREGLMDMPTTNNYRAEKVELWQNKIWGE